MATRTLLGVVIKNYSLTQYMHYALLGI